MKYDDLEHCAELASSILGLLRATGIAPGQYAAEIHGELDHVRGLFSGARLRVEEENHSERSCKAVIDAEQRLARRLSNALETAETSLVVWKDAVAIWKDAAAGKEAADA